MHSKKKYPAMSLTSNPEMAATISKLIQDRYKNTTVNLHDGKKGETLNTGQLQTISDSIRARIKDNDSIMQLFPDLKLAAQILISSVISPKDMTKNELIYKAEGAEFPSEFKAKLIDVIREHFDGHYKMKDHLQFILNDQMFEAGSHVRLVLPESIVDGMINGSAQVSMENMVDIYNSDNTIRSMGFLGNPGKRPENTTLQASLERFFDGKSSHVTEGRVKVALEDAESKSYTGEQHLPFIEISDNFQLLKMPKLIAAGNKQKILQLTKRHSGRFRQASVENFKLQKENKKLSKNELSAMLYKENGQDYEHLMVVPSSFNAHRRSVGRPLVMNAPPDAVIPIIKPGSPSEHIGYLFLCDNEGNFVNREVMNTGGDGLSSLMANQPNNQNMNSLLIDRAKKNMVAANASPTLDGMAQIYASIIENDLMERFRDSMYGSSVQISENQEIYRIMVARSLKGKMTRLVYVPMEYVSYYALDYFPNGVGKSYLDDIKNLTSIRAIVMYSKVMAQVKSSINVTKVKMTLDEHDPDPEKTIEMGQHEVAKMRQMYFPLGINSPVDLTDWLQRAGMEWEFEGHPGIPQTKFEFSTDNFKHEIPDEALDESLRKRSYMALGLSPEIVDNGYNAEFATTAIQNNILFSKRVINIQDIFTKQLSEDAHRISRNDYVIQDALKKVFEENKGDVEKFLSDEEKAQYTSNPAALINDMVDYFIENLRLELPRPDVTSLNTQTAAFKEYTEALDDTIKDFISADAMPADLVGQFGDKADLLGNWLKSYFRRRWMADNNYMTELFEILEVQENDKPMINILEEQKAVQEGLIRSFMGYLKDTTPLKVASNADLDALGAAETAVTSTDTGDANPEGGGGNADDGFGDFGNLGGDGVEGAPETPAPEEEEEEEEPAPTTPEGEPDAGANSNESFKEPPADNDGTVLINP